MKIENVDGNGIAQIGGESFYLDPNAAFEVVHGSAATERANPGQRPPSSVAAPAEAPLAEIEFGLGSEFVPALAEVEFALGSEFLPDPVPVPRSSGDGLLFASHFGSASSGDVRSNHDELGSADRQLAESARLDVVRSTEEARPDSATGGSRRMPRDPAPMPIEAAGLSVRASNCLRRARLYTLEDVASVHVSQLEAIPNLGRGTIAEIIDRLAAFGLTLADRPTSGSTSPRRATVQSSTVARARRHRAGAEMALLRLEGLSLREIGERFSVTPERVRQVLKSEGITSQQASRAKQDRLRRRLEPYRAAVLVAFREGVDLSEVAQRGGLSGRDVDAIIEESVTSADRAVRNSARAASRRPKYSDADLIAAIQRAAQELGDVPGSGRYHALARELGLPSLPTIANRFGSWTAAVSAAGMTPHASRRAEYARRWSVDACWNAMRRVSAELGGPPTAAQYELLSAGNDDLPSLATVRNRLGLWTTIVARLHLSDTQPLLARIGIADDAPHDERQEAIWLAYLADELTDRELGRLMADGLFVWDHAYGERPRSLDGAAGPD